MLVSGCAKEAPVSYVEVPRPSRQSVDYNKEIKPILTKRCVVCHSCYNSPCQLKLSSYEGLDRGATQEAVYNAGRLRTMEPTRLFTDELTTAGWRDRGFTSVTETSDIEGGNDSFLLRFLAHKNEHPQSVESKDVKDKRNWFKPEEDDLVCAATSIEVSDYLQKHPNRGMPYGFPPLSQNDFELIRDWLMLGAEGPTPEEHAKNSDIAEEDREAVAEWEEFLNGTEYLIGEETTPKRAMTARYLYEHLFLAHISFSDKGSRFYELVRSRTEPGKPIDIIATVRPYDNPGVERVYYRFRRIYSTIVYKTHMVFELNKEKMALYRKLFLDEPWLGGPVVKKGYSPPDDVNPFAVFEQIPPESRYRFLLNDIHYIIMTFIRGPVCKGQVALNVVRDHFWLLFLDPGKDLAVQNPGLIHRHMKKLQIPADQTAFFSLLRSWFVFWHHNFAAKYVKARQDYYDLGYHYKGLDASAIWTGDDENDTPVLTVFRHFDSASVLEGPQGDLPRTVWVMDFPLVERIYYALVAAFDVYGNMGHQLATRLYMDGLRQEGETYFLDFMPQQMRKDTMAEWYGGMDPERIRYQPSKLPAGHTFTTDDPKREFVEYIVDERINKAIGYEFDENYRRAGEDYPELLGPFTDEKAVVIGFHAASSPKTSFFTKVKDHNANLAYVRIKVSESRDEVVSMVVNRWHDDVRTLSKEAEKLNAEKDQADFIRGYVGAYPNYFFVVEFRDLERFLNLLKNYDGSDRYVADLLEFGVNRADGDFWDHFDWFQEDFLQKHPHTGGLFDLNRYYYLAVDKDTYRKDVEKKLQGK